jgi:hypothetical protein
MAVTRTLAGIVTVSLAASACNDSDTLDQPVIDTRDAGTERGVELATNASSELTGDSAGLVIGKTASILFVLNDNFAKEAFFTVDVLDDGEFEDYGAEIFDDHTAGNQALDLVVRGYGASYQPSTTADALAAEGQAGLAELRATPPQNVAFMFTHLMVEQHASALVLLDELAVQVGPGAMGDYIAATKLEELSHLAEGEDLLDDFY